MHQGFINIFNRVFNKAVCIMRGRNEKTGLHNEIIFQDNSFAKNSQKITNLLLDADTGLRVKYGVRKRMGIFVRKRIYASYIQVG